MSTWLLKIGFGGVQEFIGQARKTRDLAAGSALLSEAMRRGLQSLNGQAEVLLPYDPQKNWPACPHQAVLRIQGEAAHVRKLAKALADVVREAAADPLKKGIKQVVQDKKIAATADFANGQIDSAFELYWVAVEGKGADAFRRLQALFDDRRHTRTFQQLEARKGFVSSTCAQCGTRSAVVEKAEALASWKSGLFSKRDLLCGVCLGKRLWSDTKFRRFPSTVRLAWDRLLRPPWIDLMGEKRPSDEDLVELFDRWDEFEAARPGEPPREPGGTGKLWKTYVGLAEDKNFRAALRSASPYWAVAAFDGDRMGKWFSGAFFKDGVDLFEGHRALAEALNAFSEGLRQEFQNHQGRLVYAGGDDGLVFLPLDELLPFLEGVHGLWARKVADHAGLGRCVKDALPTLTCHAAVVHMREPLQPVLARLHEDLIQTKERVRDRNAFSVRVDVRGGATELMLAPWGQLPAFKQAVAALSGPLPGRLPHQMLEAAEGFFAPDGRCVYPPALGQELRRVGARGEGATAAPRELESLCRWLVQDRAGVRPWGGGWAAPHPEGFETLTPAEAFRTAVSVSAFLGRELGRGS